MTPSLRRLVWLCRDQDPPIGGEHWPRRPVHKIFSAKPSRFEYPSGRWGFTATHRARWLGEIHLPMKGILGTFPALKPGEGRWVRLVIE